MEEQLKDYDYAFPDGLVAQEPLADRSASRMMVLSRDDQGFQHSRFRELPAFLSPGDLIIANDTSVLSCRLYARKATGGKVEIFLLRRTAPLEWSVFLSPARGLQVGSCLPLFLREGEASAPVNVTLTSLREDDFRVCFASASEEDRALGEFGEMPLPPYIERPAPRPEDRSRYQTVFAKVPGAVAAPTAGLHFTPEMKESLAAKGVSWATLTLHVGAGTFLPVKTQKIEEHRMHREAYEIPQATQRAIRECREGGGKILSIGTTSLRALETWALTGQQAGETELFVRPGFQFQVVDRLLTNFHQPKSTLLMLVSALAGRERLFRAYEAAIAAEYRLFSYGDCMLVESKRG